MFKKRLRVVVTTEDFRNSTNYSDATNCPLAVAIRRQFNVKLVAVVKGAVNIHNELSKESAFYTLTHKWCSHQECYDGDLKGVNIDEMIAMAKADFVVFPDKVLILKLDN